MRTPTRVAGLIAVALAAVAVTSLPATAAGPDNGRHPTSTGLAGFLAEDGNRFDADPDDYDIVDRALATVLAEHPESTLAMARDGHVRLTAFLPNDGAYRRFVRDSLGHRRTSEAAVFAELADSLSTDGLEALLLQSHIVPGRTVDHRELLRSDGVRLETLAGFEQARIGVAVGKHALVRLADADPDDRDPVVVPARPGPRRTAGDPRDRSRLPDHRPALASRPSTTASGAGPGLPRRFSRCVAPDPDASGRRAGRGAGPVGQSWQTERSAIQTRVSTASSRLSPRPLTNRSRLSKLVSTQSAFTTCSRVSPGRCRPCSSR